jgi:Predicted membrane protein (DUF2142)
MKEREIVFLLCCLAAIHVFIFSAAFPFFNNVDEPIHFDLVVKYSHGHVPRALEPLSPESAQFLALYTSMAYLGEPDFFPNHQFPPPPWTQPVETVRQNLLVNETAWQQQTNYESSQPPLYYALGGGYWRFGKVCGFHDDFLLYGIRFLNIFFVAGLVWIGYCAARLIFPENLFLRLSVPALLAFMPQSAFYSIGNDVLSPLCFGLLFICVVRWLAAETPDVRLGIFAGLAFAATFFAKLTNLPLLLVAAGFVFFKLWQLFKTEKLLASCPALAVLTLCAGLPTAAWLAWCKYNFGDFTGAKSKMDHLGWTLKPFGEWWHHPIFTPHGLWTYLSGQLATFWQGEFWWHNRPMASPMLNVIYTVASLLLPVLALISLFQPLTKIISPQRKALWFSFASFFASLVFFAFLSVIYDFHNCPNPSREHPYFAAGRMMLGALVPFLLVYVYGIDRALKRFGYLVKFSMLALMILSMLISETVIDWPTFSNGYNWFHM